MMFADSTNLIDLLNFKTKNVEDIDDMLMEYSNLKKKNLSSLNIKNVERMNWLFSG